MKEIIKELQVLNPNQQEQKVYVELLKMNHIGKIDTFSNNTIFNILLKLDVKEKVASSSRSRVANTLMHSNKIRKVGKSEGKYIYKLVNPMDFKYEEIKSPSLSRIKKILKELNSLEEKCILNKFNDKEAQSILKDIASIKLKLSKRTQKEVKMTLEEFYESKKSKITVGKDKFTINQFIRNSKELLNKPNK